MLYSKVFFKSLTGPDDTGQIYLLDMNGLNYIAISALIEQLNMVYMCVGVTWHACHMQLLTIIQGFMCHLVHRSPVMRFNPFMPCNLLDQCRLDLSYYLENLLNKA